MNMKLTLAVVTRERAVLLRRCLDSFPSCLPEAVEALLIVNGSGPEEEALPVEAARRWPWLRILAIPRVERGAARNRAIQEARGRFVYFLDDDTILPQDFVGKLLAALERHPQAPCLGGPNVGAPGATAFQRAVELLLSSPLGAGPMRIRYAFVGRERPVAGWSLMLCNLGVRRDMLDAHGLRFPERCASAEENLLLWRLEQVAGRPVYCPELWVFHERRRSVASFCRQVFLSGQGRVQIARLAPGSLLPVTALPLAFAVYLALLPWAASLGPWLLWPARAYALACAAEAARLAALKGDWRAALRLPWLVPLGHASYAAGMATGLWEAAGDHPTVEAIRDLSQAR